MTDEVRLKGFGRRAPLEDVLAWIDGEIEPLGPERLPFREAIGRVLAEDIVARSDVPRFRRAAMDGYAVRRADLPGKLRIAGELTASVEPEGTLAPGTAVRVMTGAGVPTGADAVVMVEHASVDGDDVEIEQPPFDGQHILRVGEDITEGRAVLTTGHRVRPQDLAMLVQAGHLEALVRRRPRVMILPTGSELLPTGHRAEGSQVIESNAFMLEALARRDGADPLLHPIARDDMPTLEAVMRDSQVDLLLVTGGSSVGREDFAPVVANKLGEVAFHGVALKPGSSTGVGRIGSTVVVLGPGYPVAAYVAWDLVVRPIIDRLLGTAHRWPYRTVQARIAEPYPKRAGRAEFVRVAMKHTDDGMPVAEVLPGGSAILSTLTRGQGFLVLPTAQGPLQAGDDVELHLYD